MQGTGPAVTLRRAGCRELFSGVFSGHGEIVSLLLRRIDVESYLGIGRYVRAIDSSSRFRPNRRVADESNWGNRGQTERYLISMSGNQ